MYLLALSYLTLGIVLAMALATPTLVTSSTNYMSSPLTTFLSSLLSTPTNQMPAPGDMNEVPKSFSGFRLRNDSLQMVYFHDQTIAVVELGPNKLLLNCELIEIYNDADGAALLSKLATTVNRPLGIGFREMLQLMTQCQVIDTPDLTLTSPMTTDAEYVVGTDSAMYGDDSEDFKTSSKKPVHVRQSQQDGRSQQEQESRGYMTAGPLSLFSGIVPGTKWCGTGDIAATYHDLGSETESDKCCRTHDLCPVKVRAFRQRYNLTNTSLYTKSHCLCDDLLFECLRDTKTPAAQLMGNIYFNLIRVPCVQDLPDGQKKFRGARRGF